MECVHYRLPIIFYILSLLVRTAHSAQVFACLSSLEACSLLMWRWVTMHSGRAGQATTLPRQRDYVVQATKLLVFHYYNTIFVVATPFRHRDLCIFKIFLVPKALLRHCWVVALLLSRCRCRKAKKVSCPALFVSWVTWYLLVSRVGWSDLALFFEFWNLHLTGDQVYFCDFSTSKSAISAACTARAAKFSFSKNHRDLKN